MSDETQSRADVLSAEFDRMTTEPESVVEVAPEVVEAAPDTEAAPAETAEQKAERARGPDGKFVKAEKDPEAKVEVKPSPLGKAPDPVKVEEPKPVEPAAPAVKAPQAWTPAAREAFTKAPPEVQAEVVRREAEITRALNDAAPARKVAEQVQRTLAPFEGLARANGMDVMGYAGTVMQMAAQLFQGPPGNRAALVAQLIKQAGVNPEDVNPYLSGEAAPQAHQPAFDPRAEVQKVLAEERQRMEAERGQATVQEFIATQPEFLNDVWPDMVAVINSDRAAGRKTDLPKAYDRACRMNEDVSKVLGQRKAAETAKAAAAEMARKKAAASSVRSQPANAPPSNTGDRRAALEAAYDKMQTG